MSDNLDKGVRVVGTPGHHGYNLAFSPFTPDHLAVATAQNFGLMGGGRLFVLSVSNEQVVSSSGWDAASLLDVAWSENIASVVVTSAGDGSLQLWDTSQPQVPVEVYQEHTKDTCSVSWSQTRDLDHIVSSSWDSTLKVWDPNQKKSLRTLVGGDCLVYQAVWSPHLPGCVASVSADGKMRIWNTRAKSDQPTMCVAACDGEVLSCDWCKYNQNVIATAGTDRAICGWDLRQPSQPVFALPGHDYPVRRLKFSSFLESQLASVSYDFTTRIWDHKLQSPCVQTFQRHTEFVYGLDYSPHNPLLADCAWDQSVAVYDLTPLAPPPPPSLP